MFNTTLSHKTAAMRPGLINGRYPEQHEKNIGLVDRMIGSVQNGLMSLTASTRGSLRNIVTRVNDLEKAMLRLSFSQLHHKTTNLRQDFQSLGLSSMLCIEAFALIREMSRRILNKRHYDCQIMGGWSILHGQLAEMQTGEGKTLTAVLPAATAALAGIPVHVLTVNEYLVKRDAELMGPLYRHLGLSVGYVNDGMTIEQRREAYACDVTYCTQYQVAFDYLRDRLLIGNERGRLRLELEPIYNDGNRAEQLLLRGLCFAIVDEADSVLIDEARTPLIITRETDSSDQHKMYQMAFNLAKTMKNKQDFIVDPTRNTVFLTNAGEQKTSRLQNTENGMPDNTRLHMELIQKALHALHLLQKDRDYLIRENKIMIIDSNTGRVMADRSWEGGLHQMVEAKEGCPMSHAREKLGRLTYQQFFNRYLHIGAMSGTALEVRSELWSVYGLIVKKIPLHRRCQRKKYSNKIYCNARDKWKSIIKTIRKMNSLGRPVLIGTSSVADSEYLSQKLKVANINHQLLNAREDEKEAGIIANAGKRNQVTVATNMAGRGTDIPLGEGVARLGGLHVIAACRNDSKRIDRQLFGRCARQGDPGSYNAVLSLQDEWIIKNCPALIVRILHFLISGRIIFHRIILSTFIRYIQNRIEHKHHLIRKALVKYEQQTSRLLSFSGHME